MTMSFKSQTNKNSGSDHLACNDFSRCIGRNIFFFPSQVPRTQGGVTDSPEPKDIQFAVI